jgi:predicted phosphodiesterase
MAQQTEHIGDTNKMMTAVEWFYNKLIVYMNGDGDFESAQEIYKQAKAMEKEQIKFAYNDGAENMVAGKYKAMEDYYNENYSNENTSTKAD